MKTVKPQVGEIEKW